MSKLIPITIVIVALVVATIAFFGGAFQRDEPMVAEYIEPVLIEEQQSGVVEAETASAVAQTSGQPAAPREKTIVRRETRTSTAPPPDRRVTRRSGKPEFVVATAGVAGTTATTRGTEATGTANAKSGGWIKIPGTGVGLVPKK